jgi:ribosomal protein S18 acetylase RimI-like enzyme
MFAAFDGQLPMVSSLQTEKILNNPAWHALVGRQAFCAVGDGGARWYHPEYTTLAGLRENSAECFDALRAGVPVGQVIVLATQAPLPPNLGDGFDVKDDFFGIQMVCENLRAIENAGVTFVDLTEADVPQMKELVALTKPGPFGERTIEFGKFIGIKDGGRLIAMAGERMKPGEKFDEVSAVCTHPDFQGRGYARVLVHEIARQILQRGHVPFLHVRPENIAGIRSYAKVGFVERAQMQFIVLKKKS